VPKKKIQPVEKQELEYDLDIMDEILKRPGIREPVAQLTPDELVWYKKLLITNGIYAAYCKERKQDKSWRLVMTARSE
jgi:hypothetical protein